MSQLGLGSDQHVMAAAPPAMRSHPVCLRLESGTAELALEAALFVDRPDREGAAGTESVPEVFEARRGVEADVSLLRRGGRSVVNVEEDGVEARLAAPDHLDDITLIDFGARIVERLLGERAEHASIPIDDLGDEFADDDGAIGRERIKYGAQGVAHAEAADEDVCTRPWMGASERHHLVLGLVGAGDHQVVAVGADSEVAIVPPQLQVVAVRRRRSGKVFPGLHSINDRRASGYGPGRHEGVPMPEQSISRFPVPELADLPEDIRQQILQVQEGTGFVPNVFLVFAHRPDEFRAFFGYYDALMSRDSGLSKAEREMIVVATSAANHCLYCVVSHGATLRIFAKEPLLADQIATNYTKAPITPRQRAMLDFALLIANDSHLAGDDDFEELRAHGFDDEDIWDIGAITALFALSNRMANLTSMQPNSEFYEMGRSPR